MKRWSSILLALVLLLPALTRGAAAMDLNINSKSALLMDKTTGTILYEKNPHERLAPASVTKIMTMLLIMEAVDSGKIRFEDLVTASEAAAAKGGSQVYLKVGETMTVEEMLKSIAVSSANDCACAMAEHLAGSEEAFVQKMNEKAGELGMEDTHFVNCTGLDDGPNASEHRTSAHDIALMSRELLGKHPEIKRFTTIWMDTIRGGSFGLSNTNKLIRFYQGATGLKTGFTSGAGYCLSASALREGLELIAVVMGCESSQVRNAACKSMLDYGFANFALAQPEWTEPRQVAVRLGKQRSITPVLEQTGGVLMDKAKKNSLTTRVELAKEITAPVRKGQELGSLTLMAGEEELCRLALTAGEDIARLDWWDIFLDALKQTAMAA